MAHTTDMDPTLAAAILGFQQNDSFAGGVAFALVMARRSRSFTPWEGRALQRALKSAHRFKLSDDLAPFIPLGPHWYWSPKRKNLFRSAVIGLKQIDALSGPERTRAITDLRMLLGVTTQGPSF